MVLFFVLEFSQKIKLSFQERRINYPIYVSVRYIFILNIFIMFVYIYEDVYLDCKYGVLFVMLKC